MNNEELKFIIRFRNEADAAIRRASGQMRQLAGATTSVASAEDLRAASHTRAAAAQARITQEVFRFIAAAGPAVLAIREFTKFETGLIQVAKTTGLAGDQITQLGVDFRKLSREVPVTTQEFLELAGVAGQLGISATDDIAEFSRVVSQLGVASDLAGEEAATTLARILNISDGGVQNVEEFASVLVRLGNNAAATEREIAKATKNIVQQTARFGVSANEAAAFGAATASLGLRAETAGTTFGRAFNQIDIAAKQTGKELSAFAGITGLTETAFQELANQSPKQAFDLFLSSLGDLIASGENYLPLLDDLNLANAEALKVIGPLSTQFQQLARFQNLAADEAENTGALAEEAAAAYESFANQLKVAFNTVRDFALLVGTELAGALAPVIEGIRQFFSFVIDLDEATGGVISKMIAFVGVMTTVALALFAIKTAALAAGIAITAVTNPIGLIAVLGASAVVAGLALGDFASDAEKVARIMEENETILKNVRQALIDFQPFLGPQSPIRDIGTQAEFSIPAVDALRQQLTGVAQALSDVTVGQFAQGIAEVQNAAREAQTQIGVNEAQLRDIQRLQELRAQGFGESENLGFTQSSSSERGEVLGLEQQLRAQGIALSQQGLEDTASTLRTATGLLRQEVFLAQQGLTNSFGIVLDDETRALINGELLKGNFAEAAELLATRIRDEFGPEEFVFRTLNVGDDGSTEQDKLDAREAFRAELEASLQVAQFEQRVFGETALVQEQLRRQLEARQKLAEDGLNLTGEEKEIIEEIVRLEAQRAEQDRVLEAQRELNASLEEFVQQQQEELSLVGLTADERERELAVMEIINQARAEGIALTAADLDLLNQGLELMAQRQQIQADLDAEANNPFRRLVLSLEQAEDASRSLLAGVAEDIQGGFANAFADAIVFSDDLAASIQNVAKNAIADLLAGLIKIGIQFLLNKAIGDTALATQTAASLTAAGAQAAAWAPVAAAVSLASFGANAAPAALGISSTFALTKGLSAIAGFAEGGFVSGPGTATSDSIPALLSNGEFVMNARSTKAFLPMLRAMNATRFAQGGLVGAPDVGSLRGFGMGGGRTVMLAPSINIERTGGTDENAESDRRLADDITDSLRDMVREVIQDEARFGGILNAG